MKYKNKRPMAGFAVLALAAVLVLAAGCLWLKLGWHSTAVALTESTGDAGKLKGFTVTGTVQDGCTYQNFTLHDGYLDTTFTVDRPTAGLEKRNLNVYPSIVLQPGVRDAVNAEATISWAYEEQTSYESKAQDFQQMLNLDLPNGKALRIPLRRLHSATPQQVSAIKSDVDRGDSRFSSNYDYAFVGWEGDIFPEIVADNYTYIGGDNSLLLGQEWGVCWLQEIANYRPGLYRCVGALSDEEARQLPADGCVGEYPVYCASNAIGSLEPFYCPANAKQALAAANLADGMVVLVYQNDQDALCADLVNAAGQCTDHRELGSLAAGDEQSFSMALFARSKQSEAVFELDRIQGNQRYTAALLALRAQGEQFTVANLEHLANQSICEQAVLNADGSALMVLRHSTVDQNSAYGTLSYENGLLVEVYPFGEPGPAYRGLLDCGQSRDWGDGVNIRNFHDFTGGSNHMIKWPTLAVDRGVTE